MGKLSHCGTTHLYAFNAAGHMGAVPGGLQGRYGVTTPAVLAPPMVIADGLKPLAISQMPKKISNRPPGIVATRPVPAKPRSSSTHPAARIAYPTRPQIAKNRGTRFVRNIR